jgi:hypothetical protein
METKFVFLNLLRSIFYTGTGKQIILNCMVTHQVEILAPCLIMRTGLHREVLQVERETSLKAFFTHKYQQVWDFLRAVRLIDTIIIITHSYTICYI